MKLQDVSNFAGLDGFCWFVGQVEARVITHDAGTRTVTQNTYDAEGNQNGTEQVQVSGVTTIPDPLRLGRVKVRCIGYHTQDRDQLPLSGQLISVLSMVTYAANLNSTQS